MNKEAILRELNEAMDEARTLIASERLSGNAVKLAWSRGQLTGLQYAVILIQQEKEPQPLQNPGVLQPAEERFHLKADRMPNE